MPAALAAGALTGLNRARGMFASILPDRNAQPAPNPWAGRTPMLLPPGVTPPAGRLHHRPPPPAAAPVSLSPLP